MRGLIFSRVPATVTLLWALVLSNCMDPLSLSTPEVLSVTPARGSEMVDTNALLQLRWSTEMDPVATARALSVMAEGAGIEGRTEWQGGTNLVFIPRTPWPTGADIRIQVDRGAEDLRGNNLAQAWLGVFTTAGEGGSPAILSMEPAPDSVLSSSTNAVTLTFSKAMDEDSLRDSLSVNPSGAWTLEGDGDLRRYCLRFREDLPWATRVNLRVAAGTKARNGRTIKDAWSASFFVGRDLSAPDVSAVVTSGGTALTRGSVAHGVEKDEAIHLHFTKAPLRDSVENALRVSPSTAGRWEWPDGTHARFVPENAMTSEGLYELVLGEGLRDIPGNRSTNRGLFKWMVDGPGSRLLQVTGVSDGSNGSLSDYTLAPTPRWEGLSFDFSAPVDGGPAMSALSLARISGTGGFDYTVESLTPSPTGTRLTVTFGKLSPGNLYKVTLRNLKDRRGNPMAGEYSFYFGT